VAEVAEEADEVITFLFGKIIKKCFIIIIKNKRWRRQEGCRRATSSSRRVHRSIERRRYVINQKHGRWRKCLW